VATAELLGGDAYPLLVEDPGGVSIDVLSAQGDVAVVWITPMGAEVKRSTEGSPNALTPAQLSGLPPIGEAFSVKNWVAAGLMTELCSGFGGSPSKGGRRRPGRQ
jgi:hypothetical protein